MKHEYTKGGTVWHLTKERADFTLYERAKRGIVLQMSRGKIPHPRIIQHIRNDARRNRTAHF